MVANIVQQFKRLGKYEQVDSHRRAAAATASGKFRDEIVPVSTKVYGKKFFICNYIFQYFVSDHLSTQIVDPKTGEEKDVTISVDDGIRLNTNLSGLAKLKPAFKKDGSTTAGIQ